MVFLVMIVAIVSCMVVSMSMHQDRDWFRYDNRFRNVHWHRFMHRHWVGFRNRYDVWDVVRHLDRNFDWVWDVVYDGVRYWFLDMNRVRLQDVHWVWFIHRYCNRMRYCDWYPLLDVHGVRLRDWYTNSLRHGEVLMHVRPQINRLLRQPVPKTESVPFVEHSAFLRLLLLRGDRESG